MQEFLPYFICLTVQCVIYFITRAMKTKGRCEMQDDRENDKNVENKIEIVIKLFWRGGKIFAVGRKQWTYEFFLAPYTDLASCPQPTTKVQLVYFHILTTYFCSDQLNSHAQLAMDRNLNLCRALRMFLMFFDYFCSDQLNSQTQLLWTETQIYVGCYK